MVGLAEFYLGEKLQEVATLIEIDQYVKTFQRLEVLIQHHSLLLKSQFHRVIVGFWHCETVSFLSCILRIVMLAFDELHTPCFQVFDVPDNVICSKSDVLDSSTSIEVDVFFYLRLLLSFCWLIDGHFNDIVGRRHDHRFES